MKKYAILIITLVLLLVMQIVATCGAAVGTAENIAYDQAQYCSDRIADRVEQTINLLTALSNTAAFQGEELSYLEKAQALTKISDQFGYMMIRVLDSELRVYSETARTVDAVSSDLSKRDYLQRLKSTLQPQVTDAFLAGADGKTVNFTIAVPILKDGSFNGALFAAIYETDFAELLSEHDSILLGKQLQYMSGIEAERVGDMLDTELESTWLFGTRAEQRMLEIRGDEITEGVFSGIDNTSVFVLSYNKVDGTEWNVISRVPLTTALRGNITVFVMIIICFITTLALLGITIHYRQRFFKAPPVEPLS